MAWGQLSTVQPGTCPCAFQSLTMKPWKPMRPFSTSVRSPRLPVIFVPFQLENEAITVCTPAEMAGG